MSRTDVKTAIPVEEDAKQVITFGAVDSAFCEKETSDAAWYILNNYRNTGMNSFVDVGTASSRPSSVSAVLESCGWVGHCIEATADRAQTRMTDRCRTFVGCVHPGKDGECIILADFLEQGVGAHALIVRGGAQDVSLALAGLAVGQTFPHVVVVPTFPGREMHFGLNVMGYFLDVSLGTHDIFVRLASAAKWRGFGKSPPLLPPSFARTAHEWCAGMGLTGPYCDRVVKGPREPAMRLMADATPAVFHARHLPYAAPKHDPSNFKRSKDCPLVELDMHIDKLVTLYGSDWFLAENLFKDPANSSAYLPGFFVDWMNESPLMQSTLWYPDRCLNFTGVCVQPIYEVDKWTTKRGCTVVHPCSQSFCRQCPGGECSDLHCARPADLHASCVTVDNVIEAIGNKRIDILSGTATGLAHLFLNTTTTMFFGRVRYVDVRSSGLETWPLLSATLRARRFVLVAQLGTSDIYAHVNEVAAGRAFRFPQRNKYLKAYLEAKGLGDMVMQHFYKFDE